MDIDLELCDDKIESFLKKKLEDVRSYNKSLKDVLQHRRDILQTTFGQTSTQSTDVQIPNTVWKKIFNNKYCLGYEIKNLSKETLKDLEIILYWNSKESFDYRVHMFSSVKEFDCGDPENCCFIADTLKKTFTIESTGIILIVFKVPHFLNETEIQINGNIYRKSKTGETNIQLPKVQITPKDSDLALHLNINDVKNILTLISCNSEDDLIAIFPEEWDSSIRNTFEMRSSFTKIDIRSCKEYFIAYNISKLFENALIAIHSKENDKCFLKVYTNNNDQLLALIHYLHSSIPGILIIPKLYYSRYLCKNATFSNKLLKDFSESLGKELKAVYKYIQQSTINSSDISKNTETLYELERETDNLFLQLSNVKY
ncbi:uncharacterized protein LOC115880590 [Sitophilus oryzae]|uniref:Uncharacterized protein LOC115880590 n=1 Tax=Sitophilus oryzae TaxID=7048 RepID=A0A6J2XQR6_SITOR|nr:uncharacterized protein LOC115880590 [Sitophilus oryzae]XP_030753722.1 uncharacterized protein LOC115880590 [Sitophilus oryzae]